MLNRLKRWLRPGDRPGALLFSLLSEYPPYEAPHVGYGRHLSLAQARENLAHFEAVKSQRLAHIAELLRRTAGIDALSALHSPRERAVALTDELDRWAATQWVALPVPQLPRFSAWLESKRHGPEIVYSMLMDLAILLGEVIRLGNAEWSWALDLDPGRLRADMSTARRIVLWASPVSDASPDFVIDVEASTAGRYLMPDNNSWRRSPDGGGPRSVNPWHRMVDEGLSGAAMAFWRQ